MLVGIHGKQRVQTCTLTKLCRQNIEYLVLGTQASSPAHWPPGTLKSIRQAETPALPASRCLLLELLIRVNAGRTTSRKSHRGRDKPSDVNIVLNCLFDLVTLLRRRAWCFELCMRLKQRNKALRTKNKEQFRAECGWNYIPYKDEDPGSIPGGPQNN